MKSLPFCFLAVGAIALAAMSTWADDLPLGAYYTQLIASQEWEAYSRSGKYADVVVRLSHLGGELVFWRGNSYLPYWETKNGQWNLTEIVPRRGDGVEPMPDRVNIYSHVEIITNTPSIVVMHWRYLSSFIAGNPHGNVSPDDFVDEVFTITPDGRVERVIKKGTKKIDDWKDPMNQTTQALQLSAEGVVEISRSNLRHSMSETRLKGNPPKGSPVPGPKAYWKKEVSGTALEFDGYNTVVPATSYHLNTARWLVSV